MGGNGRIMGGNGRIMVELTISDLKNPILSF
jgi:hypothetical protein